MVRSEFAKVTKPLIHGRDRHVLGEQFAQIGTQALVLDGGTPGQLCVDLGWQISEQYIHAQRYHFDIRVFKRPTVILLLERREVIARGTDTALMECPCHCSGIVNR